MRTPLTSAVIPLTVLLTIAVALAQETPQSKPGESSTGLPAPIDWTFNFDAGWGGFAFTLEAFYLKKDDFPDNKTGSRLWGANYEYNIGDASTFGATYMKWQARPFFEPRRDGLDVCNAPAFTAPIPRLTNPALGWEPKVTYRYAFFQGDEPDTARNESFDPLFPGFYDWGTWWQGEIAGEYFVSNSNVKSHLVRVHLAPTRQVGRGVLVATLGD